MTGAAFWCSEESHQPGTSQLTLKSIPTVEMKLPARKAPSLKRTSRQVLPTPESPTSITCRREAAGLGNLLLKQPHRSHYPSATQKPHPGYEQLLSLAALRLLHHSVALLHTPRARCCLHEPDCHCPCRNCQPVTKYQRFQHRHCPGSKQTHTGASSTNQCHGLCHSIRTETVLDTDASLLGLIPALFLGCPTAAACCNHPMQPYSEP